MLDRVFPARVDNTYRGRRLGLWLLAPILFLELAIGANSPINPRTVAATADGIPLARFNAGGAAEVISLFALLGFARLLFALQGVLVMVRYRALIPFTYLLLLILHLGNKSLLLARPGAASGVPTAPIGSAVVLGLLAMILAGFALSLTGRGYATPPMSRPAESGDRRARPG